jgi:TonB family protein
LATRDDVLSRHETVVRPLGLSVSMLPESKFPKDVNERGPQENLLQLEEHNQPRLGAMRDSGRGSRDFAAEAKVVAADLARDWVLQEFVEQARLMLITSATGAFIGIVEARRIVCQAMSGSNVAEFIAYLNRDQRMLSLCLKTNTLQRCRDSETSDELDASACRYLGGRSIVLVPIVDENENRVAILGVFSPQADAFSNTSLLALQSLSRRIANAITRVGRCTLPGAPELTPVRPEPAKLLLIGSRAHTALRPLAATVKGSPLWIVGSVILVLFTGWTLGRVMSKPARHLSAKRYASPVPAVAVAPTSSGGSANSSLGSNQSSAVKAAVQRTAVKAAIQRTVETPRIRAASSQPLAHQKLNLPDLEIEDDLDDSSSGSFQSKSVDTTTAMNERNPDDGTQSTESREQTTSQQSTSRQATSERATSMSVGATSASPVMLPEQLALSHVTTRVEPNYPASAKAQHVQGTVTVDVVVDKGGQIQAVRPVDGDSRLVYWALRAVSQWRFTPLVRDGHPVSFESHISLHFTLP